ncbi:MAG: phosphatidate cytidylyltransferase [Rhizobiaceae bacterium]
MSNLQLRVISAVILAAVVLAITWLGGTPFRLMACLIGAAILFEWSAMSSRVSGAGNRTMAAAGLAIVLIPMALGASAVLSHAILVLVVIATALHALASRTSLWSAGGLAYAGLSALSLAYLRDSDSAGLIAILFLFAVVWATDILAYFVGRAIGGPKLAPAISPGKTQSGALGGAAGGIAAGLAIALATVASNLPVIALVALILSIVSQVGDLFESWVKRRHGVKDSGSIIPGHGGVMDRVDGLVAAAFALYVLGALLGGMETPAHGLFGR